MDWIFTLTVLLHWTGLVLVMWLQPAAGSLAARLRQLLTVYPCQNLQQTHAVQGDKHG